MKATELIKAIEKAIEKYGDINVGLADGEFAAYNLLEYVTVKRPLSSSCDEDDLGDPFIGLSGLEDQNERELEVIAPSGENRVSEIS